jgi:hypothetical protein
MPFVDSSSLKVIERLPGWYGRYVCWRNMKNAEVKIATLIFLVLLSSGYKAQEKLGPEAHATLTIEQVQPIVQRYVNDWNSRNRSPKYPLWVILAGPGDPINIPGATFGTLENPKAGMEFPVNAHLILINKGMMPESILTTFTHEYGHAQYRLAHQNDFQEVDSEVAAVKSSLTILPKEGFEYLAYREAKAIKEIAKEEPYRGALQRLSTDPVWIKYAQ